MTNPASKIELPKWQSHKVVEAAKIISYDSKACVATVAMPDPDGGPSSFVEIKVPQDFHARGTPTARYAYLVRYEDGYLSWSPSKTFEDGYRLFKDEPPRFDIGDAIEQLHNGKAVARVAWTGIRMLVLVPGSSFRVELDRPLGRALPRLTGMPVNYNVHIDVLEITTNTLAPWQPTTEDILAQDWLVADLMPDWVTLSPPSPNA